MRRVTWLKLAILILPVLGALLATGSGQQTSREAEESARIQTGMAHLSAGNLPEAIREFKQVLQENPSLDGVHFYLSQAYNRMDRWKEALKHIDRAIQLRPQNPPYYNHRALIFSRQKQFTKALTAILKAIELRPPSHLKYYYFNLAGIYRDLLRLDDARDTYSKTLAIDPNFYRARVELGKIYLDRNRTEKALEQFTLAAQIEPATAELYRLMGRAHARAQNHPEAVRAFRRALELNPRLHTIHYRLGMSLKHLGQIEASQRHLETFQSLQAEAEQKEYHDLQVEVARRSDLQRPQELQEDLSPVQVPLHPPASRLPDGDEPPRPAEVLFRNVAREAGVDFRHLNGATPEKYMPETMGSGGLFFDFNNDGWIDIFLVNGGSLVDAELAASARHSLYRNNADGTFREVTPGSGIGKNGYGMGACAADYDNDGWVDLYLAQFGENVLYRNNGDETFSDVTPAAGVGSTLWSSSCAFADIDNDGDVDLYVVNYVDFALDNHKYCGSHVEGLRSYCHPNVYQALPDLLYRNDGDGTFTDITREASVYSLDGKGLGVAFGDYNGDGWTDIYVANDSVSNFLYRNQGNGKFSETALWAGVAVDGNGPPEAGMGTDWGDFDNDGLLDLYVTNLNSETHTLYHNAPDGLFTDVTWQAGLGEPTLPFVGFGTAFFDYDSDGDLDLVVAQGHILDNVHKSHDNITYPQRNLLFRNEKKGIFAELGLASGPGFKLEKVSRGLAFGDIDNDGDLDLLINNCNQTADLLRNEGRTGNNWLLVKTFGTKSNRDGIGTRLSLTANQHTQIRQVSAGSSYQSQNDLRVHFGLGHTSHIDVLELRWPSGTVDVLKNVKINQILKIREGKGIVP